MKSIRHLSSVIKEQYQTNMEKAMAAHSSTLAWKIPWTTEPGGLQFMGSLRVRQAEWLPFHFSLSCIGEGNGNPLQCSFLKNPRDGRAPWASVYGVTQSQTGLKWRSSSSIKQTIPRCCVISLPCTWAIVSGNSCCCYSVTKSCLTLWDPMDCSMPNFPVPHYLPVCPSSYTLNQWCHPTIPSSKALFSAFSFS